MSKIIFSTIYIFFYLYIYFFLIYFDYKLDILDIKFVKYYK